MGEARLLRTNPLMERERNSKRGRAVFLCYYFMSIVESTLQSMEPISLSEMDSVALMDRVDTKYVLSAEDVHKLLAYACQHNRVLSVDSVRMSPYATLYFDTPEYECYLQHHNGKLNRRKYRMRQYKASGISFLEVKSKNNKGRTKKVRIPIDDFEQPLSSASCEFIESVTNETPDLIPQLWSHFSRITLVSRDLQERITIDLDLEFSFNSVRKSLPRVAIVEVKQARNFRHSAMREHLRREHIRPMRVSKYCIGNALLKPQLKSNRFNPKLRAIRKIAS